MLKTYFIGTALFGRKHYPDKDLFCLYECRFFLEMFGMRYFSEIGSITYIHVADW